MLNMTGSLKKYVLGCSSWVWRAQTEAGILIAPTGLAVEQQMQVNYLKDE